MNGKMTAKTPAVGIDLGTTYSCVGIVRNYQGGDKSGSIHIMSDQAGQMTFPSAVLYTGHDGMTIVGYQAQNQMFSGTGEVAFDSKRLIGRPFADPAVEEEIKCAKDYLKIVEKDGHPEFAIRSGGTEKLVPPEYVSAEVLKKMKELAKKGYGPECTEITQAVITYPAYFNDSQIRKTEEAAMLAGFTKIWLLKEPIAAALPYGQLLPPDQTKTVLVFDFGGGGLHISIVRVSNSDCDVLGVAGDSHLGGRDLDQRLEQFVVRKIQKEEHIDLSTKRNAMRQLRKRCEETKKQLSEQDSCRMTLEYNDDEHTITVKKSEFEEKSISSSELWRSLIWHLRQHEPNVGI